MKIFCLGAAGRISRESVLDLLQSDTVEKVTIGDNNESAGQEVVEWLEDDRVDFVKVDVFQADQTAALIQGYDLVMDGTPISINHESTQCIAQAGVHGVNLNGTGPEFAFHDAFLKSGKTYVPGFGMTPGITNVMARYAHDRLETIDTIRISHGAFRPFAFSPAITETTRIEYEPDLESRIVFENGEFKQVEPFARPLKVTLPEPFGTHTQYIIPHAETQTIPKSFKEKGVRLVEVRGTWPPANMQLLRALYDWGFLENKTVNVDGVEVGVMDAIASYLLQSKQGTTTQLYGYALHVEVTGKENGKPICYTLTSTHPASDGSIAGWEDLRAYTRSVGIPMSIAAQLILDGQANAVGVVAPELAFDPEVVFAELEKRQIVIHIDKQEVV
ncbi:MAG: saccharopine dehydrogenase C-terminal domain-containing protein [Verrucomicrobiota bacterium]|nr:saccharopine dehydrogenase C-terminal domain-containing protein [Verrucomicrobiota bacterium]